MRRTDVFGDDGAWTGLSLEVESRGRPGLCPFGAEGRFLLLQGERPVLLAAVADDLCEVGFRRTDAYRSVIPPTRAAAAREAAGRPDRWAYHFAEHLAQTPEGPLHDGRWLLTPESPLLRWNHGNRPPSAYWGEMIVEGHPGGVIDWFAHNGSWEILPLRPMPDRDDARVKAYRKQARDGSLPPVLLWWVSGLDCHVVLDGHARLAAAVAESVTPPLLHLHRTAPGDEVAAGTERAAAEYEAELARFARLRARHGDAVPDGAGVVGPVLARRLERLRTEERPTWAWPLPGGRDGWGRVAREVAGGGPPA
ncbi:hypothetical protein ACFQ7A_30610 [Streptomyces sp. NPDC056528]|uniref:hypothetical protein n=1 Tax=Streptomyces sp. NPDC056528 TaxID=3345854 RepID=UPI0036BD3547